MEEELQPAPRAEAPPRVTVMLLIANAAAGVALLALADPERWREAFQTYGFVPSRPSATALFTSLFIHAGLLHFASNMYLLAVFGQIVEGAWGAARFSIVYFAGGLLGGAAHWRVHQDSTLPLLGASGAVAALMGAVAVAFPFRQVHVLGVLTAGPLAYKLSRVPVQAGWVLIVWFGLQALNFVRKSGDDTVAWTAHVIGFACGAFAALLFRKPSPAPDDDFDS